MGITSMRGALGLAMVILLIGCGGGGDDGRDGGEADTFTLSGTLLAATGTDVDWDVNDPNGDYRPNDDFFDAQPIPNPVTLGGYASALPFGPPSSRFATRADRQDWFRVEMTAGQSVSLFTGGNSRSPGLTLSLHRLNGEVIDIGSGSFPSLTAPDNDEYLIRVQADNGAGNYILTVGRETLTGELAHSPRLSDSFVPGQVVVRYRQEVRASLAVDEPALGRWLAGDPAAGSVLLELPRTAVARAVANLAPDGFDPLTAAKLATLKAVESLNRDPAVKWAEPNYLARASFIPPDRLYPRQWHYPLINLPQAWDLTQGRRFDNGQPVIVAVLDTGIVSDHPDLRGQTVGGYDFISDPVRARDGDGIDPNPEDPGDLSEPDGSSSFHGTHVAGIVVARAANSATVEGERVAAFGVVGSAFAARVMPLRVLGRLGEGTFFDIEQAIRYAAGLPNSSGTVPSRRADVINLSLGSIAFSASLQETLDQARAAGVVAVAAAGNSGTGAVEYPAAFKGVMSVAAVGQDRRRAPYSTFNRFVDVAAPGGDMSRDLDGDGRSDGILSTWTDDGQGTLRNDFTYFQGTSMAAPHMAGVTALMLAANPRLTPGDIDALLAAGAISDDLGDNGRDDEYGFGLIDAFEAVASAIEARGGIVPDPLPLLSASPPGLNFALNRATIDLKVSASGAELRVAPPVSDAFWLRISPLAVEETGLGEYRVTVERSALEDGLYTSEIIFTAQEQTLRIPVIMQVSRNLSNQDLGPQYVLLVDPDSDEVFSSVRARRQDDGSYRYRFDQVPQGQYQIFAGSDLDNNGIVCEAAEACGAFRTLDLPQRLEISGNRDDLDFDGSFTAALPGSTTLGSLALPTEKALPR